MIVGVRDIESRVVVLGGCKTECEFQVDGSNKTIRRSLSSMILGRG